MPTLPLLNGLDLILFWNGCIEFINSMFFLEYVPEIYAVQILLIV